MLSFERSFSIVTFNNLHIIQIVCYEQLVFSKDKSTKKCHQNCGFGTSFKEVSDKNGHGFLRGFLLLEDLEIGQY